MITKHPQWRHQRGAYDFVRARPRGAMIALPMGAGGKTKIAIDLLQNSTARTILIACPKPVVQVWVQEFEKHLVDADCFNIIDLDEGAIKKRTEEAGKLIAAEERRVVVINYEAVWREPFRTFALAQHWDVVIADECHRIKSAGGKASLFFKELRKRTAYALGLSGTPMPHSPLDIYAQARFLDDRVFGTSKARFLNRYAFLGGFSGYEVIGWQNLDELNEKFHSLAFTVPDEELDVTMPREIDVRRYTRLEADAARVYRELQKEFISQVKDGTVTAANAAVKVLRLQQVTGGWVRDEAKVYHEVSRAKLQLLESVLDDLPDSEPVVVFCRFTPELAAVCEHLSNRTPRRRVGELSGHASDLLEWQRGELDDLVVQIQAGAEGIDLSRARYIVFYSPGIWLGKYQQARRRIARPSQHSPVVTYIHLLCRGTYDETVYRGFAADQEVIDLVVKEAVA